VGLLQVASSQLPLWTCLSSAVVEMIVVDRPNRRVQPRLTPNCFTDRLKVIGDGGESENE